MSQEAFRRLANELRSSASNGGNPLPGGKKGFFAGSGFLIMLIGGGLVVNASLFNGALNSSSFHLMYTEILL
jgi:prohibitin 2